MRHEHPTWDQNWLPLQVICLMLQCKFMPSMWYCSNCCRVVLYANCCIVDFKLDYFYYGCEIANTNSSMFILKLHFIGNCCRFNIAALIGCYDRCVLEQFVILVNCELQHVSGVQQCRVLVNVCSVFFKHEQADVIVYRLFIVIIDYSCPTDSLLVEASVWHPNSPAQKWLMVPTVVYMDVPISSDVQ